LPSPRIAPPIEPFSPVINLPSPRFLAFSDEQTCCAFAGEDGKAIANVVASVAAAASATFRIFASMCLPADPWSGAGRLAPAQRRKPAFSRRGGTGTTKAADRAPKYLVAPTLPNYGYGMTAPLLDRQAWGISMIAWTVFGTLMLMPSVLLAQPYPPSVWINVATSIFTVVPLSILLFAIAQRALRWPALQRYLLFGVMLVALGGAASVIDAAKGRMLMDLLEPGSTDMPVLHRALRSAVGFITEFAIILSLHLVLLHVREGKARAIELAAAREEANRAALAAAAAESAAASARLEALRYQLNPHFLFNTLNAISSSVVTGRPEAAEATLARLCDFLRATLSTSKSGMVPVEDELQTIADYLAIEKARLGDRLRIEFDCPLSLREAAIPSFLLQPLVENAIKHGVGATSLPVSLRIEVSARDERLKICVQDDAASSHIAAIKGTGLGLANVRARLAAVFGDSAFLDAAPTASGFRACITLPLTAVTPEPIHARAAG
jgi:hypothetical protein